MLMILSVDAYALHFVFIQSQLDNIQGRMGKSWHPDRKDYRTPLQLWIQGLNQMSEQNPNCREITGLAEVMYSYVTYCLYTGCNR